ncbi:MAG: translation initiation factor [Ferruginibacter sp.]
MSKKIKSLSGLGGLVYSTDPNFKIEEEVKETDTLPPAKQPLRIRLDTKHRAGKAVTLITGFEGKAEDAEALGKKLKSYCGTGGSVKDGEIIVQGDNREKVMQWLQKNGYTAAKRSG